jgi:hypothetical protein
LEVNKLVDNFEDGKPIEEYVNTDSLVAELNELEIAVEHSPEATQTLEVVAEPPVRNEKKQKKPELPKSAAVAITQNTTTNIPQHQPVIAEPIVASPVEIVEESLPNPQPELSNAPAQPQFKTLDEYIAFRAQLIREQYMQAGEKIKEDYQREGEQQSQNFVNGVYGNLVAMINGEAVLVPANQVPQQQTQPPEPQPAPEPVSQQMHSGASVDEQLRRIDAALKDPALAGNRRALLKKKCELLDVPFDESAFTEPASMPVPVNCKKVNDVKPQRGRWSLKACLAMVGVVALVGVAIVLLIGALQ